MINSATEEEEEEFIVANSDATPTTIGRRRRLWSIPSPSIGTSPSARWGHCSVLIQHQNINYNHPSLLIFGGFDGSNMLNDIHLFDTVDNSWKQPLKTFGLTPTARSGHSTTLLSNEKGKLLLVGGGNGVHYLADLVMLEIVTENDEEWKKEILKLNFDSSVKCFNMFRWTQPKVSSRVRVYISDDDIILTEEQFHKLQEEIENSKNNVSNQQEENLLVSSKVVEQYIRSNQSGTSDDLIGFGNPSHHEQLDSLTFTMKEIYPAPRSRHTAVTTENGNKVLIFGGGGKNRIFDDLWILDVNEMEWSQPQESAVKPGPRWGHSACVHSGKMYIYGGVFKTSMLNDLYVLDLATYIWVKVDLPIAGPIPFPRAAHTANIVLGRYLFILWGGDDTKYIDDLYILDLESNKGRRIAFKSPKPRCAHTACQVDNNYLLVFGGGGNHQRFKELYLLDIKAAMEKVGIEDGFESDDEFDEISTNYADYSSLSQYLDRVSQTYLELRSDIAVEGIVETNKTDTNNSNTTSSTESNNASSMPLSNKPGTNQVQKNRRKRSGSKKKTNSMSDINFNSKDVKEVTNWLVDLGLGRYANLFLQEEIDLDCIPLLTDADLFKLGISKFGPRKKILDAAKRLVLEQPESNIAVDNPSHRITNPPQSIAMNELTEQTVGSWIQSMNGLSSTCENINETLKSLTMNISNLTLMLTNPYYGLRHPTAVAISMYNSQMHPNSNLSQNTTSSPAQVPLSPKQTNSFTFGTVPPPPSSSTIPTPRPRNLSNATSNQPPVNNPVKRNPLLPAVNTSFVSSPNVSVLNKHSPPQILQPASFQQPVNNHSATTDTVDPTNSSIPPPPNADMKKKRKRKPKRVSSIEANPSDSTLPSTFSAGESWYDVTEKDFEQDSE